MHYVGSHSGTWSHTPAKCPIYTQLLEEGHVKAHAEKIHGLAWDYREAEEAWPELGLPVIEELRLCLEQCEEIPVPVLVRAPVPEVLEDGVHLILWVRLEVPEDSGVPPVPDLLWQVGGVEDELGLVAFVKSSSNFVNRRICDLSSSRT